MLSVHSTLKVKASNNSWDKAAHAMLHVWLLANKSNMAATLLGMITEQPSLPGIEQVMMVWLTLRQPEVPIGEVSVIPQACRVSIPILHSHISLS